ncbi:MAG: sulfotransferase, partial [Actinobacteria bacterium]|nr:sulfotransferase [Actinomycetota bacterium]
RHVLVRYEDLMADPRAALAAVGVGLGRDASGLGITDDRRVALGVSHSVAGNPRRFASGPVELRADVAWRSRLSRRDRLVVTLLALPALRRFGYRLRG